MKGLSRSIAACMLLGGMVLVSCSKSPEWGRADGGGSSGATPVEALAARLPEQVLAFAATSGSDYLEKSFDKTYLAEIWKDPNVQQFCQAVDQELQTKMGRWMGMGDVGMFQGIRGVAKRVLRRPVILGAALKQDAGPEGPPLYAFLMVDAGPRKEEMQAELERWEAFSDPGEIINMQVGPYRLHGPKEDGGVPGYWGFVDEFFVFAIHDGAGAALEHIRGRGDKDAPASLKAMRKVAAAGDLLAVYGDLKGLLRVVNEDGGEADGQPAGPQPWIESLGLGRLESLSIRCGIDGPNLVCAGLAALPQPFAGLPACLGAVDPACLGPVHGKAGNAVAFNVDPAKVYDLFIETLQRADSAEFAYFQRDMDEWKEEAGFGLREELLEALAGPVVAYTLPMGLSMDLPNGGLVLILDLRKPDLMESILTKLGESAKNESDGMVQIGTTRQGEAELNTWTVAPLAPAHISPTWTLAGSKLVLSTSPEAQREALKLLLKQDGASESLMASSDVRRVVKKLPENLKLFSYVDQKVMSKQMLFMLQSFWPMWVMLAQQEDLNLPTLLPSVDAILDRMGHACTCLWCDGDGIRFYSGGF